MPKTLKIALVVALATVLSGCSFFYPNWGATSLPEETEVTTEITESASPEVTETESAEPTPTETSTSGPKKEASVVVVLSEIIADEGILNVVAEMDTAPDSGGTCTLRVIAGAKDKSYSVKSEPSSTYTLCFPFEVPLKDLAPGNAVITVSYSSDLYEGKSVASSVVIP